MSNRILITGCSRGIGHALAMEFSRHDWRVIATGRRLDAPLLESLAAASPNVDLLELDVRSEASIARAAAAVTETHGTLDVIVNNAAVFPEEGDESLEQLDLNWFQEAFETNVVGAARVVRQFLPLLRAAGNARVVNISSGAGSVSEKEDCRYYAYSVSKAALNMLTRAMAADLRRDGIIVAAVSPGWVRTDMGGSSAPLSADESAASLYKAIEALGIAQSGQFLDRDGTAGKYRW